MRRLGPQALKHGHMKRSLGQPYGAGHVLMFAGMLVFAGAQPIGEELGERARDGVIDGELVMEADAPLVTEGVGVAEGEGVMEGVGTGGRSHHS